MQELQIGQVFSAIEDAFRTDDLKRAEALLWPAVEQFPDISQFWFYGGCVFFKTGRPAVASQMFRKAIELDDAAHIYSNLGACYRRMNLHEEGKHVLQMCLDRDPNYAPALVNLGSMYVNEGCPDLGIPHLERAEEIGGEHGAIWNLGLLYLEAGRFGEGFDRYRQGVSHERAVRTYGGKEGIPEPTLYKPHMPREGKRIIVWGEQGIGDELMFATCLPDAMREFGEVILECHPRLEAIHKRAWPSLRIYPTRKDEKIYWPLSDEIQADYKAPLGDLAALYRRDFRDFDVAWQANPAPYRTAAVDEEVARYRASLLEIADGRPIVGLATRGGVMTTARTYRTLKVAEADYLFQNTDCLFVALDYDDMLGFSSYVTEKYGEHRYKWFPSIVQHWDYEHAAALIAATDLTVTVCQTAAHISAGMGHPTRVLTPKRCAWRYAPTPGDLDRWYWYPGDMIKTYRQDDPESWMAPLSRVVDDIRGLAK